MKLHRLAAIALLFSAVALGNGETTSPNMNLTIPAVGVTIGPTWATDINASLNLIDAHDHSSGKGVQVTPSGMNISADLAIQSHNLTGIRSVRLQPYTSAGTFNATASDVGALLEISPDLYYRDANGNLIRLTISGGPNSGTGNISGLPSTPTGGAGIAWQNSQSTFQFTQDDGTAGGNADVGTLILRYAGSYPSPSGNYVAFQAPSSLATGYAFTVPATAPAASGAWLTSSTAGVLSYTNVDNSTVEISSATLRIKDSGVTGVKLNSNVVDNSTLQYATSQLSIKNLGVGTAQIAAGAVTQAKLATKTVSAGSAINFSVPDSQGGLLITNGAVTLTTTGRPVVIFLQTSSTGLTYGGISASTGNPAMEIRRDGSSIGTAYVVSGGSFQFIDSGASAASHTYQIYGQTDGSSTFSIANAKLNAYEL